MWAASSVGRAPRSQRGGRGFESHAVHQIPFWYPHYRASIDVKDRRTQTLKEAWIGDAVLTLYARLRILGEDGAIDGAKSIRMTSNQFLSAFGEPSEVEAQIGRVFEEEGLDAAFAYVRDRFMPLYEKQEAGRRHRAK